MCPLVSDVFTSKLLAWITRHFIIIMIIIIIITIAFKGAIRDLLQSPHSAVNSPTRTLKWPRCNREQITLNTSSADHVQVSCYVPPGTKRQLSY